MGKVLCKACDFYVHILMAKLGSKENWPQMGKVQFFRTWVGKSFPYYIIGGESVSFLKKGMQKLVQDRFTIKFWFIRPQTGLSHGTHNSIIVYFS